MYDPNITMEEYIRLEEEKAQKRRKVFNWETASYGKIWYDEVVHDLKSVETEFPALVFNDSLTSNETLSCEPTVSSYNDNEIDFRMSFDESGDEDYTVVFDKNSFSYKIISTNDLKTYSENDNEKVSVPLFPSSEPTVSCIDDLDFFKDFENVFPAIVYNDALTSKSDFSTEPTLCPQNIDEFDLKDETSLSEYDEMEKNVLNFNDIFSFNIIYPNDLKSDKGNDDNEIDMIQSSGGNENTQGSNILLEGRHDKISKVFIMRSFIIELNVKIVAWNHLVNGMLFNLIKNLYVPFGIPFDSKRYYKEGDCTRILRRPRSERLILDKGDLSDYWVEISSGSDILRGAPSYTYIRDPVRRLCHRLISYSISERGQAPKKVTATDLFYLRSMDRGAANILYLLAQYLFRHAKGRKSSARLFGGHFVGRLAHHFDMVSDDELRGLSVVAYEFSLIDIGDLVKLNICREIGDDWAWVASGPKRQQVAAASAPKAAEDAPEVNEGAQADSAPIQVPQPPPLPPDMGRTMP
ncbi:hypothetical protein Tco_0824585 [Tanacetum coccineum]|uniref:Uncharacterized protein n=1 Tax=Tanacetum coccineum TaxID=301880 RepID=A0ABQ5AM78_9ASTR